MVDGRVAEINRRRAESSPPIRIGFPSSGIRSIVGGVNPRECDPNASTAAFIPPPGGYLEESR